MTIFRLQQSDYYFFHLAFSIFNPAKRKKHFRGGLKVKNKSVTCREIIWFHNCSGTQKEKNNLRLGIKKEKAFLFQFIFCNFQITREQCSVKTPLKKNACEEIQCRRYIRIFLNNELNFQFFFFFLNRVLVLTHTTGLNIGHLWLFNKVLSFTHQN